MPEMTQRANLGEAMCHCPPARAAEERSPVGSDDIVLHVPLSAGLNQGLRAFAKNHGIQPETAAREAIRAYVGDDQ